MSAFNGKSLDRSGKAGIALAIIGGVAAIIAWFVKSNTDEKRAEVVHEVKHRRRDANARRIR
jgi:phage protein U